MRNRISRIHYEFIFFILIISLFGCTTSKNVNINQATKEITQMPVIKIQTESNEQNVMDFVTRTQGATVMAAEDINQDNPYLYGDMLAYKENTKITVINKFGKEELTYAPAQVKVRGNYTSVSNKKPLKIEFSEQHSMLGLHGGKEFNKWVLLSSFKDPSYLRDTIGFDLFKLLNDNYYASDSKLVEVYINDNYWGIYVLAEQQESKRLDITEAKKDFISETGYLFELDTYGWTMNDYVKKHGNNIITDAHGHSYQIEENYFCSGFRDNWNWYTFKSKCDENKLYFLNNYLNKVYEICLRAIYDNDFWTFDESYSVIVPDKTCKTSKECISKIIDIESLVNTYILSEIVCDQDLNHSSFYLSVDFGPDGNKKLTFQAPWDFDSTLGHISAGWCGDLTKDGINNLYADHYSDNQDTIGKGNFWTTLFMQASWFKEDASAKWKKIKKQKVLKQLIAKIDSTSDNPVNIEAFERDYKRWEPFNPCYRDSSMIEVLYNEKNQKEHWKNQKESAEILKDWLIYRFDNLNQFL